MIKEVKTGTYFKGEESFNFNFNTDLSVANKLKFVNSVCNLVVNGNSYNSVIKDLVFDFFIIDIMTDIDMSEFKKSSAFLDDVEEFLMETNIVEIVKANVFPTLFDELNNAVDDSIEYLTGIHKNPLNNALTSLINTFERKISEVDLENMMSVANKLNGITDDFTIENLVNAYVKSDVHKQNLEEIKESKKKKSKSSSKKTESSKR